jgi:hypothetical protein
MERPGGRGKRKEESPKRAERVKGKGAAKVEVHGNKAGKSLFSFLISLHSFPQGFVLILLRATPAVDVPSFFLSCCAPSVPLSFLFPLSFVRRRSTE